ncbi:PaaI family thioesterase [Ligilactobacillus acidipiscis]|uniref:PaaI family thioesterase n=1 Tax=Ligilactobacillus acidipiscis TaxID=89059 RepID=A0A921FBU4_9LACO|nr:PaaI family thioesterase [Ligilactobacillus acidipiscis]WEV57379.1 PaaI family thioesterase [Ligilactobacillus acidipiscis]HJE98312.1 PaaI family thioesterase [Ligilactobacillus acidipiscis]
MSDLVKTLGIKVVSLSSNESIISLEISDEIKQPYGIVHGGINAVLAETAASMAGAKNVPEGSTVVGVDLTTHHLQAEKKGTLLAKATPLHVGSNLQTWQVEVHNNDVLTSVSQVTLSRIDLNRTRK